MVLVAVRVADIIMRGAVPLELSHHILASQWRVICETIDGAHRDAVFLSCCCECATCVVFAFPCIFCFHPCIMQIVSRGTVAEKVQQLNNSLFDGYPVLMERDGTILFETDMIRLNETVYVDRTNTGEYNGKTLSTSAYNSPLHAVTAQPVDATNENYVSMANAVPVQNVRTLLVRVPNNAGHGSVLSVTAPDGSMLSVVVPPNLPESREITVAY